MAKMTRILAFDPSTTEMGAVVLDFKPRKDGSFKTIVVYKETKKGRKFLKSLIKAKEDIPNHLTDPELVTIVYTRWYKELYEKYKPDYVCSESGYSGRHMSAFRAILLVIVEMKKFFSMTYDIPIYFITPCEVKKCFSGNGGANKDFMRISFDLWYKRKDISLLCDDDFTEHEIDATAHGITVYAKQILPLLGKESSK